MLKRREFFWAMAASSVAPAWARNEHGQAAFAAAMQAIERQAGGRLGVAVLDMASGAAWQWRGAERFPMCSTFKFLLAAQALHAADRGTGSLDDRVRYERADLVEYSPVTEAHAGSADGMTVRTLCEATVTLSDNTAANLLLARQGGPAGLTRFLRQLGDTVTRLDRIEPELNEALAGDERDTTTPAAMLRSMRALVLDGALSTASRAQLKAWLIGNKTGDKRLRAGLRGWLVGDKTGSGNNGSSNDVGVFWPPQGRAPVLVTCYMTQTQAPANVRDQAIADVARQVAQVIEPI